MQKNVRLYFRSIFLLGLLGVSAIGIAQENSDPNTEPCTKVIKDSGKPYFKKWFGIVGGAGVGGVFDRWVQCQKEDNDTRVIKYPYLKLEIAGLRKNLPDLIEPVIQLPELIEPTGTTAGASDTYGDQIVSVEEMVTKYVTASLKPGGQRNSTSRARQQRTAINSIQNWLARAPAKGASFPEIRGKQYWAELIPKANSSFAKIKKQFGSKSTPGSLEIFKAIDAKLKGA
jgi:hypothetical protein